MITADIFGPELLIPLILLLVLIFGVNKLPKMAKNLGEASKEFKKAQREAEEEAKAEEVAKATKSVPADQSITMSKSELDALIAEREAKARRESEKPSAN
jgi:sec-independent protein translocase protein TatA